MKKIVSSVNEPLTRLPGPVRFRVLKILAIATTMVVLLGSVSAWAIKPRAYASLQDRIRSASFASDKLNTLRSTAQSATFTSEQVGGLIDLFDFSSDKLKALSVLRTRIEDPENAFVIVDRFTYDSDKQQAANAIEGIESALPKRETWKRRKVCYGEGPGRYCYTEYYER